MKSYIPFLPTKWISRGCTVCFVGDVYQEDTFCYLCGEPETTSVIRPFLCEKSVRIHGKDMLLLRTVCSDDYKRLRQVMYPACDLIVFCYSLRDDSLLGPLSTQLIEEIRESVRHYIPSMVLFSLNGKSQETSQEHIEALRKGGEKLAREVTNSITLVEIDISNSSKDQSRWDQERQRVIEIMYRILVLHGLTSSNKTVSRCSIC
ncbi:hypothetical protein C9374_006501 [Naegleria lovaniensis]|uniref:Uncharacterized protein n=1 Tax=Naegleria lovaniensis TaxID=51637 RepID=A0AA88KHU7_NAELO|nr:uncharacterized protein C9374_006501 [Naegleria lovaniensis]KAG2381512.1 hypothetical protein C9374_006501 [Naegleria lovaniensis]